MDELLIATGGNDNWVLSPDGSKIYLAGTDGKVRVYSATDGSLLQTYDVGTFLNGIAISPDGQTLGLSEGTPLPNPGNTIPRVYVITQGYTLNLATGQVASYIYDKSTNPGNYVFADVAFSGNGTVVFLQQGVNASGGDAPAVAFDIATGTRTLVGVFLTSEVLPATLTADTDGSILAGSLASSTSRYYVIGPDASLESNNGFNRDGETLAGTGIEAYSGHLASDRIAVVTQSGLFLYDGQFAFLTKLSNIYPDLQDSAGLAFNADGSLLYAIDRTAGDVLVINTSTFALANRYHVGALNFAVSATGQELVLTPDAHHLLINTDQGIYSFEIPTDITGTPSDDTLIGTDGKDRIYGLSGADTLRGLAGNDLLDGGPGDDNLIGGDGNDKLLGGDGRDILNGDDGNDFLDGGAGNDLLRGGSGSDTIYGGEGDDRVIFADYPDSDYVDGGDGTDTLQFSAGGSDPIVFSIADPAVAQHVYSATFINFERLSFSGGVGDDSLTGGNLDDFLGGNDGNDTLRGGLGNDTLDGGFGKDTIYGGEGDDLIRNGGASVYGEGGNDTIFWSEDVLIDGGIGVDLLHAAYAGSNDVFVDLSNPQIEADLLGTRVVGIEGLIFSSGSGDDRITGGVGDDNLSGGDGNDILLGGSGNDTLAGGEGTNELYGGTGDDELYFSSTGARHGDILDGGEGFDQLHYSVFDSTQSLFVDISSTTDNVRNIEQIYFRATGPGDNSVYGGSESDLFFGGSGADTFFGRAGDDDIRGFDGDDVLVGGLGADFLEGGAGSDTVSYADVAASVFVNLTLEKGYTNHSYGDFYSSIENVIGSSADDFIIGDTGVNTLEGGDGNDILLGAFGSDALIGGAGNDWASYEENSGTVFVNLTLGRGYNNGAEGDTLEGIENLVGGLFDDFFIGDEHANRLNGAMGADTLLGAGGADIFMFTYAPGATSAYGSANIDLILDFTTSEDKIELSSAAFTGLAAGTLSADAFHAGTAAHDADDRIVYDAATGKLWFDADGNGAGAAVLFATLGESSHPAAIAATDFVVV